MLTRSLYDFSGEYFGLVDYQDGDTRSVVAKFMLNCHFVKVSVVVNLLMNKAMELCSGFMIILIFWHYLAQCYIQKSSNGFFKWLFIYSSKFQVAATSLVHC